MKLRPINKIKPVNYGFLYYEQEIHKWCQQHLDAIGVGYPVQQYQVEQSTPRLPMFDQRLHYVKAIDMVYLIKDRTPISIEIENDERLAIFSIDNSRVGVSMTGMDVHSFLVKNQDTLLINFRSFLTNLNERKRRSSTEQILGSLPSFTNVRMQSIRPTRRNPEPEPILEDPDFEPSEDDDDNE